MTKIAVTVNTEIELDVALAAQWFSGLTDELQTQFFVEVAKIADTWPGGGNGQWYHVGGHLRNCACSTEGAREMIRSLAHYMETSTHT